MSNTPVATLDNMVCPYNKCIQNRTYNILECDYKTLTNNQKGFKFEMEVQNVLDNLHLDYTGNPNIWNNWIKEQGSSQDYDIKLDYNNLRIECKYVSVRPYHNSFLRDWYNRHTDIIVTSNKDLVSIQDKELLKSKGVILLSITELFNYLSKLIYPTSVHSYSYYNLSTLRTKKGEQIGEQAESKGFIERFKSKITKLKTIMYEVYGHFKINKKINNRINEVLRGTLKQLQTFSVILSKSCRYIKQKQVSNNSRQRETIKQLTNNFERSEIGKKVISNNYARAEKISNQSIKERCCPGNVKETDNICQHGDTKEESKVFRRLNDFNQSVRCVGHEIITHSKQCGTTHNQNSKQIKKDRIKMSFKINNKKIDSSLNVNTYVFSVWNKYVLDLLKKQGE
ncbi:MAG: hypothetical protein IAX21_01905 [Candidatus Bathyarchaeota archaeon]|nr:MAG: hypothetical protein IAX21_01905 [Candidatus Bathyarchaeota archaeon]